MQEEEVRVKKLNTSSWAHLSMDSFMKPGIYLLYFSLNHWSLRIITNLPVPALTPLQTG